MDRAVDIINYINDIIFLKIIYYSVLMFVFRGACAVPVALTLRPLLHII
jgi:hypothetical protein